MVICVSAVLSIIWKLKCVYCIRRVTSSPLPYPCVVMNLPQSQLDNSCFLNSLENFRGKLRNWRSWIMKWENSSCRFWCSRLVSGVAIVTQAIDRGVWRSMLLRSNALVTCNSSILSDQNMKRAVMLNFPDTKEQLLM